MQLDLTDSDSVTNKSTNVQIYNNLKRTFEKLNVNAEMFTTEEIQPKPTRTTVNVFRKRLTRFQPNFATSTESSESESAQARKVARSGIGFNLGGRNRTKRMRHRKQRRIMDDMRGRKTKNTLNHLLNAQTEKHRTISALMAYAQMLQRKANVSSGIDWIMLYEKLGMHFDIE